MAKEHLFTTRVRDHYNQKNVGPCRVSDYHGEQLTEQHRQAFELLSGESKQRFYGSGLHIPENLHGKRVLDIGCGSGSLVFLLSRLVGTTGYVMGCDVSDGFIETAKAQSEYHWKQWGYDKANFEFHVLNAEQLGEAGFQPEEFDIIVSNRVLCLTPDKEQVFRAVYKLLKTGGQFCLNDVYAEKDVPEQCKDNEHLWLMGATGSMRWDTLAPAVCSMGFSTPHLLCVDPVPVATKDYNEMLHHNRYLSAGWRLFKLDTMATQQGPSLVTYVGGITDYPEDFRWDVDLTFKKGVGVEVDGELATLLSSCYLSQCFSFQPVKGRPVTHRNQNPFQLMDQLKAEGRLPKELYSIE